MTKAEITADEYSPYYAQYIALAGNKELIEELFNSESLTVQFFESLPEDKLMFRYAEGKWTPLEILQHIIDTERIFAYRAFRFARMDKTPLPGFEQDDYVNPSQANDKSLSQLIKEFKVGRQHSISLFQSLSDAHISFIGNASGSPMSARAVMAIIVGHEIHHINIMKERYL